MSGYMEKQFKISLKKSAGERDQKDVDIIYSYLHGMEALSSLREPALRSICKTVRYEFHDANDILYCSGELSTCWYILLSGSVFIDGSMFLPRSSFGKRTTSCARRQNECLILEPSEMIVVDYPDVPMMKAMSHTGKAPAHLERLFTLEQDEVRIARNRLLPTHHQHSTTQMSGDCQPNSLGRGAEHSLRSEQPGKRTSHASDTSSAYSGSDMMQSSIDDQDIDLSGLVESMVDSDDEEGYVESSESMTEHDTVRDCLEKDPADRTEDDIEILLEFMQHLPAFANMTLATRRALCAVMVFAVVDKAGTIVMNDGEELDSWSVILNGHVEITGPDDTVQQLHMGDSFGITPTMEKLYHKGVMRTKVDDCQFVCIAQQDYYRILHQGEENTRRHQEGDQVVMVTEHRILDSGNRKGYIVIRGTAERLMQHLVEEHSAVDPTYVEDFLLTYRTVLSSPMEVANRLQGWFNDSKLRDRVTRVVLLWVNNHFNDFETEPHMAEFLERFELLLERERMFGQLRLLNIACAAKARPRTIVLTRATRDEILHFSVLGGLERGCGLFISKVEKSSKAHEAGLKRGDQILEVNNHNFEHISHNRALEVLRGTTHLSITVKSNLLAFKEMLITPESSPGLGHHRSKEQFSHLTSDPLQRMSAPDLDECVPPVISPSKVKGDKKDKGLPAGQKSKIRKALMKFNIKPRNVTSDSALNHSDENLYTHRRKGSSSSSSSSPSHMLHLSASNPDLSSAGVSDDIKSDYPEHVLKIYKADQSFKYLLVHQETTAREVVMLALREFGLSDSSSNYSLCEVSVESENFIKQKRLPDQMCNLPDRISLNGRYYLKNNMSTDTLVPDEMMNELIKDNAISMLQLKAGEIAAQLTLRDFTVFHDIESTEYVDDLFGLKSKYGTAHLQKFSQLANMEMFWVVTEVCNEPNVVKRMKIVKHFIKIARHCKDCKNFNSMFAIISGLANGSVARLRSTWDRLPTKYTKLFQDMYDLMDPSRNMSKYRNLVNSDHVHPPLIPFFPVVKKDLTFIHLGNDSKVDGLVNFEKLRMIAKEVRHICNMCSAQYDVSTMLDGGAASGMFSYLTTWSGNQVSAVATMRRKNRRSSTLPNPKRMYEEAQMVRRVCAYLKHMPLLVVEDEQKLSDMSFACEPAVSNTRKRDSSPNSNGTSNASLHVGPKFGVESSEGVRKLMGLAENVKTHKPKHNHQPSTSPHPSRRPLSPRLSRINPVPVRLSSESSSVASLSNIPHRKSNTSSIGSNGSSSPTSLNSLPQFAETDSGHNSIASSNYDSHSTSSVGSASSPPSLKRAPPLSDQGVHIYIETVEEEDYDLPDGKNSLTPPYGAPAYVLPPPVNSRPPLPPYHMVVKDIPGAAGYNHYLNQQYSHNAHPHPAMGHRHPSGSRPPLPDYHAATQMAMMRQNKGYYRQNHTRSRSCDGLVNFESYYENGVSDEVLVDDEEEQVSAV